MENTSGQGSAAPVPPEIERWNWGAFLLHWIWGIGNNTLIALLMFVPLVNVVMVFILGAKGSTWAWRNKRWESVEQFKDTQRKWAIWGVVAYGFLIATFVALFFIVVGLLKNTEAYQFGLTKLQASSEAMAILGPPISTGMVQGSIETSGPSGTADISFSVKGQKAEGTVYVDAKKDLGRWLANRIELEIDGRQNRIDLNR
jgi:hypothetical protein